MLIAGCTQCSGNLCYQVWRTWKKSQLWGSCPEGLLSQRKIENIFYRTDEVKVVEYILLDSCIKAAERLVYVQNKTKQCFFFLTLSPTGEIKIAPKHMHTLISNFLTFCRHQKQTFWQNFNFNFVPLPLVEGGTKIMEFLKNSRRA